MLYEPEAIGAYVPVGMEKHRARGIAHSVKGEKVSAPPLAAEAASLIRKETFRIKR